MAEVSASRAELLKIQAERARFQLEQEREKWALVSEVDENFATLGRAFRVSMLAVPARCSARVPGLSREIVYELDLEIRAALTEFAACVAAAELIPAPASQDAPDGLRRKGGRMTHQSPEAAPGPSLAGLTDTETLLLAYIGHLESELATYQPPSTAGGLAEGRRGRRKARRA